MTTEDINPRFRDLDLWPTLDALKALQEEQAAAIAALGPALPALAKAVDESAQRLRRGGRLVYAGAGTSARIGVQDGAELLPTFNWPAGQVAFAIAGGEGALLRAVENAEDSAEAGVVRIRELGVGPDDVVIGIAASGATPYTIAAVKAAKAAGALTIGIANNPGAALLAVCDDPILIETGAEAPAGSTRMKAGTAQKVVLNLFSTMVMVRLGKVYDGLMVHMLPTNEKLRRRSAGMVVTLTGCSREAAAGAIAASGGDVKLAVLIAKGVEAGAGRALLEKHAGNLRGALSDLPT
jgi:N-acetylmuramic acid 6-phosphate etherase